MEPHSLRTAEDLEAAFQSWNEILYRYAYLRLRDRELTEDVVQEAFIKAWKSRESFDANKASLKTWLFRILSNTLIDQLRKKQRRPQAELSETISTDDDIAAEAAQSDQINYVLNKITDMEDREQELLLLRYREGLSIKEIGEVCDLKESATKVAIHRAIKKLRESCEWDVTNAETQRIHP